MPIKVLVIGVIRKDDAILMRKKPVGSPPYRETWYLFGGETTATVGPEEAIKNIVRAQAGIEITIGQKFSWDTEIKHDLDGVTKYFIYLDVLCDYVSGELHAGAEIERLEWVAVQDLSRYDIVPPSRVLFQKLGYLA